MNRREKKRKAENLFSCKKKKKKKTDTNLRLQALGVPMTPQNCHPTSFNQALHGQSEGSFPSNQQHGFVLQRNICKNVEIINNKITSARHPASSIYVILLLSFLPFEVINNTNKGKTILTYTDITFLQIKKISRHSWDHAVKSIWPVTKGLEISKRT